MGKGFEGYFTDNVDFSYYQGNAKLKVQYYIRHFGKEHRSYGEDGINTDLSTQRVDMSVDRAIYSTQRSKEFGNMQKNQIIHFNPIALLLETQGSISTRKHEQDHSLQHCTQNGQKWDNDPSRKK